jgi:hypothetical protein
LGKDFYSSSSGQRDFEGSMVVCEILLQKQHQQAVRREEGRGGIIMIFYTT